MFYISILEDYWLKMKHDKDLIIGKFGVSIRLSFGSLLLYISFSTSVLIELEFSIAKTRCKRNISVLKRK